MTEIPTAEQSAAKMVDIHHQIAEGHRGKCGGLGQVITPPPDLSIRWNNIVLKKDKLYLNEYWLRGHRREAKGHIKSGTQSANCGCGGVHAHGIDNDYTDDIIYTDTLKPGDRVSVYPVEAEGSMQGQLFMVESKMVKL